MSGTVEVKQLNVLPTDVENTRNHAVRRNEMEIYRVADTESAQEFWDAALGRLKVYVETQRQDSGVVIDESSEGQNAQ